MKDTPRVILTVIGAFVMIFGFSLAAILAATDPNIGRSCKKFEYPQRYGDCTNEYFRAALSAYREDRLFPYQILDLERRINRCGTRYKHTFLLISREKNR